MSASVWATSNTKHFKGLDFLWWTRPKYKNNNFTAFLTMILHKSCALFPSFLLACERWQIAFNMYGSRKTALDATVNEWLSRGCTPKKSKTFLRNGREFIIFANNLFRSQNGTNMFSPMMHLFIYFFHIIFPSLSVLSCEHKRNDRISMHVAICYKIITLLVVSTFKVL